MDGRLAPQRCWCGHSMWEAHTFCPRNLRERMTTQENLERLARTIRDYLSLGHRARLREMSDFAFALQRDGL